MRRSEEEEKRMEGQGQIKENILVILEVVGTRDSGNLVDLLKGRVSEC